MLARFAVADEFLRARIKVLLGASHTFLKRRGRRLIQNLDPTARAFGDIDLIQAGVFIASAGRNDPDLPGRQRIAANAVLAVKLGRGHELLHPVLSHRIAELGIAKLGGPDPLLLFLDPPAAL